MTAYAVRSQAGGQWWSRYGGFGPFCDARIYRSGAKAMAAYKDHYRKVAEPAIAVEVVEIEPVHRSVYSRWP